MLWHELTFMGSQWGAPGLCTCSGTLALNCSDPLCVAYGPDNVQVYTQTLNAVGAALTVDLQLLRNAEQVATLKTAWAGDRWLCEADHGNATCCCGQAAKCATSANFNGVEIGVQCRADKPVCRGFTFGSAYGTCVAQ